MCSICILLVFKLLKSSYNDVKGILINSRKIFVHLLCWKIMINNKLLFLIKISTFQAICFWLIFKFFTFISIVFSYIGMIINDSKCWNYCSVGGSFGDLILPVFWAASNWNEHKKYIICNINIRIIPCILPWSIVRFNFVEVSNGHGILGLLFVIANTRVLKSVTPQNFIW